VWQFEKGKRAAAAPAEKPMPKKEAANPAEERAASALRVVKSLLRNASDARVRETAKEDLKALIRKYPGTKAAREAGKLLEEIK
jgi:hypothetical protein